MKALVIGGGGFVGPYLVKHLTNDLGYEVTVTKTVKETLNMDNVTVKDLDILDIDQIKTLLEEEKADYIFHLAAQSSVAYSWKNPTLTVDVNIKGCINLLEAIRQIDKKPRVLLIGSGEEYGHIKKDECPIVEDNVVRPGNIYAATKSCQNMLGKIYSDAYNLDIMMVRAFNHIGPNQTPMFVVADFCKQVADIEKGIQEPVINVGNLSAKRDFTDVRDVVKAYAKLVAGGKRGETYNVGTGHAVAIEDILKSIIAMSDKEIEVKVDPAKLRPVDVPIIEPDISKIKKEVGWEPVIPLEQTLKETLEHWRKEQN
ncbi:MAG: GDP-mannose 4,6-dehydratase [Eubacteriales bacterium]|nr:GDP-mannose 4,6-dehydratase [Eubacteriales bacterium]